MNYVGSYKQFQKVLFLSLCMKILLTHAISADGSITIANSTIVAYVLTGARVKESRQRNRSTNYIYVVFRIAMRH